MNDRLRYDERHRSSGTGVLTDLRCGIEMSIRDAAVLMIIVSDNCAFNMIVDTIGGVESVNAAFQALGLYMTRLKAQTGASAPSVDGRDFAITSAFETCALLATIARRAIVSPEACDDMLSILRRQPNRDKLSRNLRWDEPNMLPNPADNWVASKDGINAFNAVRNDAANMNGPRGEVAIAAFTEGCGGSNPGPNPEGNILLGEIGELVWKTVCA